MYFCRAHSFAGASVNINLVRYVMNFLIVPFLFPYLCLCACSADGEQRRCRRQGYSVSSHNAPWCAHYNPFVCSKDRSNSVSESAWVFLPDSLTTQGNARNSITYHIDAAGRAHHVSAHNRCSGLCCWSSCLFPLSPPLAWESSLSSTIDGSSACHC